LLLKRRRIIHDHELLLFLPDRRANRGAREVSGKPAERYRLRIAIPCPAKSLMAVSDSHDAPNYPPRGKALILWCIASCFADRRLALPHQGCQ
jgi:hypothetical protein